jgi:hypothetical protein
MDFGISDFGFRVSCLVTSAVGSAGETVVLSEEQFRMCEVSTVSSFSAWISGAGCVRYPRFLVSVRG